MTSAKRGRPTLAAGFVALLALSLVVTARLRLLDVPLERDEGEYAYIGQRITEGVPPFVEAYTLKLPGTAAAYAAFLTGFGHNAAAIRLGLLLTNLTSAVFLALLARSLHCGRVALFASAAFAVLSLGPSVLGPFAHATHFVMLFALAGLLAVLGAARSGRRLFVGGLLLGMSLLMKQNGAFFALLALVAVTAAELRTKPGLPHLAARLGLLCLGIVLPLAATGLLVLHAGAWGRFWFWVVSYGWAYASEVPLSQAWTHFTFTFSRVLTAAPILWMLTLGGLGRTAYRALRAPGHAFPLAFAAFSAVAVCPGFHFRPHYFVLLLPAAALLAGIAVDAIGRGLARPLGTRSAGLLTAGFSAIALAQPLFSDRTVLFGSSPRDVSRLVYGANPFPEAVEVAAYVGAHTAPHERIAVLGSEPQIYFYARRRAATGYLYMYPLMEPQPFARRMQDEVTREIELAGPAFVIFVDTALSWLVGPDSDRTILEWANRFVSDGYQLGGQVELSADGGPSRSAWGDEAVNAAPATTDRITVWRRKPGR